MKAKFFFIPAVLWASHAQATIYLDIEDAQKLIFPGASFSEHFITLDQVKFNAIIDDSGVNVYSRNIKAWKASTGGWFVVDQVRGRDDWITYAIGVDAAGRVHQIEILECLDGYDGVRLPNWRAQFYGKKRGANFEDIQTISGSTMSSGQIRSGVKRILSTLALSLQTPE